MSLYSAEQVVELAREKLAMLQSHKDTLFESFSRGFHRYSYRDQESSSKPLVLAGSACTTLCG